MLRQVSKIASFRAVANRAIPSVKTFSALGSFTSRAALPKTAPIRTATTVPLFKTAPVVPARSFSTEAVPSASGGSGGSNTMHSAHAPAARMNAIPLLFALGLGVAGYFYLQNSEKKQKTVSTTVTHQSGKIDLGGPFSGLIDQDGKEANSEQYLGRYPLIYFGFTHCPDICPTELQKMMRAINKMEARVPEIASQISPIFISVDPLRDNPSRLKEYSELYHKRIRWLTGPDDRLLDVAKKFRMYFSVPEDVTAEDDYNVDHSIFFFLMDKKGQLLNYYGQNLNAEEIAASMTNIIKDDMNKKDE